MHKCKMVKNNNNIMNLLNKVYIISILGIITSCGNWNLYGAKDRQSVLSGCNDWFYIEGTVVDKDKYPISNVNVSICGNIVATTDSLGSFYVSRVNLIKLKRYNKIELSFLKDGYITKNRKYTIRKGNRHVILLKDSL